MNLLCAKMCQDTGVQQGLSTTAGWTWPNLEGQVAVDDVRIKQ